MAPCRCRYYQAKCFSLHFKAVVPYYGGNLWVTRGGANQSPYDLTSGINCPLLFPFGEVDQNPSQRKFYTYASAVHAFMDFAQPHRYNKDAADPSWPRTLELFAQHLQGAAVTIIPKTGRSGLAHCVPMVE